MFSDLVVVPYTHFFWASSPGRNVDLSEVPREVCFLYYSYYWVYVPFRNGKRGTDDDNWQGLVAGASETSDWTSRCSVSTGTAASNRLQLHGSLRDMPEDVVPWSHISMFP